MGLAIPPLMARSTLHHLLQLCGVHATVRVSPAELKPNSAASGKKPDKAFKKKGKKSMPYFFFYAGDHSFTQECKEGSEESGSSCSLNNFCSSSGLWEGDLKCALIGKHSTGCIKDIEGNINHISGYLCLSSSDPICKHQTSQQINTLHISAMTMLPHGMKQDRTLPSSCPKLCLFYEPDFAARNSHWYKTYLLYATAKLIACAYQLSSLQFCFSWLKTHL